MERYVEGKPGDFVVAAENMDDGGQEYIVGRLDGRLPDEPDEISWLVENGIHKHFRTCEEAEKVARELTENYVKQPLRVRFHRHPVGAKMPEAEFQSNSDPDLSVEDIAAKLGKSTDWVIRKFRDEPGVIRLLSVYES
jgi:hypothetical protein